MHCRVFTVRFSSKRDRFDDEEVVSFLADKELVEVRDHFFLRDGIPYLGLLVLYNGIDSAKEETNRNRGDKEEKKDYRELLSEEDWAVFKRLREWRNEKAKAEGVPPYILLTNRQLALIATKRPDNLTKLGSIEGVGKAKIDKMGGDILRLIGGLESTPEDRKAEQTKTDAESPKEKGR